MDRSFIERNRASTNHIRHLIERLSEEEMRYPVGEHWTVAITLAHLAFWDRRVLLVLDRTEQDRKLFIPEIDLIVNDIALPLWEAIPSSEAARLALQTAQALDKRLEEFPPELLEELYDFNQRYILRTLHREEHLAEAEAALNH